MVPEEQHIKREKTKARALRKTQWWQRRCQNATCYYCGDSLSYQSVTMDHIVPLSKGGVSSKGNVVTCCKPCNNNKKNQLGIEFLFPSLLDQPPN